MYVNMSESNITAHANNLFTYFRLAYYVMLCMSVHKETFHTLTPTNALMLKLYFLHTIHKNSGIIIVRELLNVK